MISDVVASLRALLPDVLITVGPDTLEGGKYPSVVFVPETETFAGMINANAPAKEVQRFGSRQPVVVVHLRPGKGENHEESLRKAETLLNDVTGALYKAAPGGHTLMAATWKGGVVGAAGFAIELSVEFDFHLTLAPSVQVGVEVVTVVEEGA